MCLSAGFSGSAPVFAALPPVTASAGLRNAFITDWRQLQASAPGGRLGSFVVVDIARQQLYFFKHGGLAATWPVSTARHGTGERDGSGKTPLGVFEIVRKIGAGLPEFSVLSRHGPTGGRAAPVFSPGDPAASRLITTRILMLQGLEPGWNEGGDVDTYDRHIYIHGTADLGQLGEPVSNGCIQMAPGAMIRLFRAVRPGTLVLILPGSGSPAQIPGEVVSAASAAD